MQSTKYQNHKATDRNQTPNNLSKQINHPTESTTSKAAKHPNYPNPITSPTNQKTTQEIQNTNQHQTKRLPAKPHKKQK